MLSVASWAIFDKEGINPFDGILRGRQAERADDRLPVATINRPLDRGTAAIFARNNHGAVRIKQVQPL